MQTIYEFLQYLGLVSLETLWFPISIWTLAALLTFSGLCFFKRLNPLYQYHLRSAIILAIPFGLMASFAVQYLTTFFSTSKSLESIVFVVQSPFNQAQSYEYTPLEFSPNLIEPYFLIGLITSVLFAISLVMFFRLGWSYITLKKLYSSLSKTKLSEIGDFNSTRSNSIDVAFHNHPLVPFTYGWLNPIIVLPNSIKDDQTKVQMAIQHELVHINRGDYLLQLFLSLVESIFWFHPLIRFGAREIEIYREISCDQEVLNTAGISLKNYASMLYELVPLERGLGNFSISMAVKKSTLKQRIETMKYHKFYTNSIKRSLLFLGIMILAITVPIACSDIQNLDESSPDIETAKMTLKSFTLHINGEEIQNVIIPEGQKNLNKATLDGVIFGAQKFGTFVISAHKFEGAINIGKMKTDEITFSKNSLNVQIKSLDGDFISSPKEIWVRHFIDRPTETFRLGGVFYQQLMDNSYIKNLSPINESYSEASTSNEEGFYRVVEKMPELIGGMASIRSKIVYPKQAKEMEIEGRVIIQLIVTENGDVENPQIVRGIGGGCDEAALAVVKTAKFIPGMQRGEPVKVKYTLPITFKLNDSD